MTTPDYTERINALDISLFAAVPSQTSPRDKSSLLAVQRATAKKHKKYAYLEIGSHLGGSIQPHLLDDRCEKIFSIDPRPTQQPDDRWPGHIAYYENNRSDKMLKHLGNIPGADISKIKTFESAAAGVNPSDIFPRPRIIFIDGEHTKNAVIQDFMFCVGIMDKSACVLFHDFDVVYQAILDICDALKKQKREFAPLKLDGQIFAIFFDAALIHSDPYLTFWHKKNKHFLKLDVKLWMKRLLPAPVLNAAKTAKRRIGNLIGF